MCKRKFQAKIRKCERCLGSTLYAGAEERIQGDQNGVSDKEWRGRSEIVAGDQSPMANMLGILWLLTTW